jgi:hypothetical protein
MIFKLFSFISLLIAPIYSYVNFELKYKGNIELYGNESLRFSTALNEKYQIFNYDKYPLFSCLNTCEKFPNCKGIYYLDNGEGCIGLSYLGEYSHLTTKISESYIKILDHDLKSNYSCYNRCDFSIPVKNHLNDDICWCDRFCSLFSDCCSDYSTFCINPCYYQNGFCDQTCKMTNEGYSNCNCTENYFLSQDGISCHPTLSINGMIYDNYHEHHKLNRNITIEITDGNKTYFQNVGVNGEYSFHNLRNNTYKLRQIINNNNCSQIFPSNKIINVTLPAIKEYDFENFCGVNCECDLDEFLVNCNYDIGYGECLKCNSCDDNEITFQNCSTFEDSICIPTPTTTLSSTATTSETSTATTSETLTATTTETSTTTTSETLTATTSETSTATTSETSTATTSETLTATLKATTTETSTLNINYLKSKSDSENKLSQGSIIGIIIGSLTLLMLIILVSLYIIRSNNERSDRNNNLTEHSNEINSFSNPVYNTQMASTHEISNYQDITEVFDEDPNIQYVDVIQE